MSFFKLQIKLLLALTLLSFPSLRASNGDLSNILQSSKRLSGNVKTTEGEPLPGVTIMVTGVKLGTVTDSNGNFSLEVPSNAESLQFSFIGMKTQIVPIGTKIRFDIILEEESIELEEIVAVGYGVQRKESIVGSISQVGEEDLQKVGNVPDLRTSLTGQIPGLTTITSSGEPGGVRRSGS